MPTLQHFLPKRALTQMAGLFAGWRGGALTTLAIERFVRRYGVNMARRRTRPAAYPTFNEFFTRPLARWRTSFAEADFLCPVDGAISQFGPIAGDQIFQAKAQLQHAGTGRWRCGAGGAFQDGAFATLYLSPKDYHRIHMPCDGTLRQMIYVPGDLFSVNPATARSVPGCSRATSAWCACSTRHTARLYWCWLGRPLLAAWQRCGIGWSAHPPAGGETLGLSASGATAPLRSRNGATKWAFLLAPPW